MSYSTKDAFTDYYLYDNEYSAKTYLSRESTEELEMASAKVKDFLDLIEDEINERQAND